MKLQEYCQITWVTAVTFYHYIFVVYACIPLGSHAYDNILGAHSSIITFLCLQLNKRLHQVVKKTPGGSGAAPKQLSSGEQNRFFSRTTSDTFFFYRKVCRVCSCVSPRSLWTRTWRSAFPGSSSAASSGLSWSAPRIPVSLCVPTDSAWMWPLWQMNGRAVWDYVGGIWRQTWGLQRIFGCLHWHVMQYEVTLTFMYLTSISVFFSSSTITSLWNFLNYQRTNKYKQN